MNNKKILILDPNDYDVKDYKIGEFIKFKEDDKFYNAIITDIDYSDGSISIEFIK